MNKEDQKIVHDLNVSTDVLYRYENMLLDHLPTCQHSAAPLDTCDCVEKQLVAEIKRLRYNGPYCPITGNLCGTDTWCEDQPPDCYCGNLIKRLDCIS